MEKGNRERERDGSNGNDRNTAAAAAAAMAAAGLPSGLDPATAALYASMLAGGGQVGGSGSSAGGANSYAAMAAAAAAQQQQAAALAVMGQAGGAAGWYNMQQMEMVARLQQQAAAAGASQQYPHGQMHQHHLLGLELIHQQQQQAMLAAAQMSQKGSSSSGGARTPSSKPQSVPSVATPTTTRNTASTGSNSSSGSRPNSSSSASHAAAARSSTAGSRDYLYGDFGQERARKESTSTAEREYAALAREYAALNSSSTSTSTSAAMNARRQQEAELNRLMAAAASGGSSRERANAAAAAAYFGTDGSQSGGRSSSSLPYGIAHLMGEGGAASSSSKHSTSSSINREREQRDKDEREREAATILMLQQQQQCLAAASAAASSHNPVAAMAYHQQYQQLQHNLQNIHQLQQLKQKSKASETPKLSVQHSTPKSSRYSNPSIPTSSLSISPTSYPPSSSHSEVPSLLSTRSIKDVDIIPIFSSSSETPKQQQNHSPAPSSKASSDEAGMRLLLEAAGLDEATLRAAAGGRDDTPLNLSVNKAQQQRGEKRDRSLDAAFRSANLIQSLTGHHTGDREMFASVQEVLQRQIMAADEKKREEKKKRMEEAQERSRALGRGTCKPKKNTVASLLEHCRAAGIKPTLPLPPALQSSLSGGITTSSASSALSALSGLGALTGSLGTSRSSSIPLMPNSSTVSSSTSAMAQLAGLASLAGSGSNASLLSASGSSNPLSSLSALSSLGSSDSMSQSLPPSLLPHSLPHGLTATPLMTKNSQCSSTSSAVSSNSMTITPTYPFSKELDTTSSKTAATILAVSSLTNNSLSSISPTSTVTMTTVATSKNSPPLSIPSSINGGTVLSLPPSLSISSCVNVTPVGDKSPSAHLNDTESDVVKTTDSGLKETRPIVSILPASTHVQAVGLESHKEEEDSTTGSGEKSNRHHVVASSSHDGRLVTTIRLSSNSEMNNSSDNSSLPNTVSVMLANNKGAPNSDAVSGGSIASLIPSSSANAMASLALLMRTMQQKGVKDNGQMSGSDSEDSDVSSMGDEANNIPNNLSNNYTMPSPWISERQGDLTQSPPAKRRRKMVTDENQLRVPLSLGWRRETSMRCISNSGVRGEVVYYAPCGKVVRQYPDIIRYLERNNITEVTRDNFSFSSKLVVGEYVDGNTNMRFTEQQIHAAIKEVRMGYGFTKFSNSAKEQERIKRLDEYKKEKEANQAKKEKEQQELRKQKEELNKLKIYEQLRKVQEREQEKQKQKLAKEQDRERRRYHGVLVRCLETRKKFEDREKRKEEIREEKRITKERKKCEREAAREINQLLKEVHEDMELTDHTELPPLQRCKNLSLSPSAAANVMMIAEFINNFGAVLGFDMDNLPSLASLQACTLSCQADGEDELVSVLCHLLVCVIEDPGVYSPSKFTTVLGQHLSRADVTPSTVSEILRAYLSASAHVEVRIIMNGSYNSERDKKDYPEKAEEWDERLAQHQATAMSHWLTKVPFAALNPSQKAEVVAYVINDLLQNKSVLKQIENSLERHNALKTEKWKLDAKIRKLRMTISRKRLFHSSQFEGARLLNEDSNMSSSSNGLPGEKKKEVEEMEDEDMEEGEDSGAESDANMEDLNDPDCIHKPSDADMVELEDLQRQMDNVRQQLFDTAAQVRATNCGQDRYQRVMWMLPNCGGPFVEGKSSCNYPPPSNFPHTVPESQNKQALTVDNSQSEGDDKGAEEPMICDEGFEVNGNIPGDELVASNDVQQEDKVDSVKVENGVKEEESLDVSLEAIPLPDIPPRIASALHTLNKLETVQKAPPVSENDSHSVSKLDSSVNCSPVKSNKEVTKSEGSAPVLVNGGGEAGTQESKSTESTDQSNAADKAQSSSESVPSTVPRELMATGLGLIPGQYLRPEHVGQAEPLNFSLLSRSFCCPVSHFVLQPQEPEEKIEKCKGETTPEEYLNSNPGSPSSLGTLSVTMSQKELLEKLHQTETALPIPPSYVTGWWELDSMDQIKEFERSLNDRGLRERELKRFLEKHTNIIKTCRERVDQEYSTFQHISNVNHLRPIVNSNKLNNNEIEKMHGGSKMLVHIPNTSPGSFNPTLPTVKYDTDGNVVPDVPSDWNYNIALKEEISVLDYIISLEDKITAASMQTKAWCAIGGPGRPKLNYVPSILAVNRASANSESESNTPTPPPPSVPSLTKFGKKAGRKSNALSKETHNPIHVGRERLVRLEEGIERRYLKPPLAANVTPKPSSTPSTTGGNGPTTTTPEDSNQSTCDSIPDAMSNGVATPGGTNGNSEVGDAPPASPEVFRGLSVWRASVAKCETAAQLHMCAMALDNGVAWDKSIMKAFCQFCHSGDHEEKLLLCDGCDKGYHTHCFRPPMVDIPDGDWFCYECVNKELITRWNSSNGGASPGSFPAGRHCLVCGGTEGKNLLHCALCPRSFHGTPCANPPVNKIPRNKWHCRNCHTKNPRAKRTPRPKKSLPNSHSNSTPHVTGDTNEASELLGSTIKCEEANSTASVVTPAAVSHSAHDTTTSEQKQPQTSEDSLSNDLKASNCGLSDPSTHINNNSGDNAMEVDSSSSNNLMEVDEPANEVDEPNNELLKKMREREDEYIFNSQNNSPIPTTPKKDRSAKKVKEQVSHCKLLLTLLEEHADAWPFLQPVNTRQFPAYKKVIRKPMDLSMVRKKLEEGSYKTPVEFSQDLQLMFNNCETFNEDDSPVGKAGHSLRAYCNMKWADLFDTAPAGL